MGWLDALIFGFRDLFFNGADSVRQAALNFVSPLRPTEDVGNGYVTITIDAVSSSVAGVAPLTTGANKVAVAAADAMTWALLVNANVDPAAAIAGTKIVPNFGSEDVVTLGDVDCGNVSTGDIDCDQLTATGLVIADNYRSGPANDETLGANKVLVVTDSRFQSIDPTAAVYTIELPVVTSGLAYRIYNKSGVDSLDVKHPGGGALKTLTPGTARWFACTAGAYIDMGA